ASSRRCLDAQRGPARSSGGCAMRILTLTKGHVVAGTLSCTCILVACGGPEPKAATQRPGELTASLVAAIREEAKGDRERAKLLYLDTLERAVAHTGDPWQLPVVQASLDGLVMRTVPSLSDVSDRTALVFRTKDTEPVHSRLMPLASRAPGPLLPGLFARA